MAIDICHMLATWIPSSSDDQDILYQHDQNDIHKIQNGTYKYPAHTNNTLSNWNETLYTSITADTPSSNNIIPLAGEEVIENVKYFLMGVVNPALCVMGLLGNILNIVVLTRRRIKVAMDCNMERTSRFCLLALAICDMAYCVSALPRALLSRPQVVFDNPFRAYLHISGPYLQNVFTKTSTCLTVIMAVGRYSAICWPLQSRNLVSTKVTRISVIMSFLLWTLLLLPMCWTFNIETIHCAANKTYYITDNGYFSVNVQLHMVFTIIWVMLGVLLPVIILAYCNCQLMKALKESLNMRQHFHIHNRGRSPGSHITVTLIAVVCMYLILVTPAEILKFCFYAVGKSNVEGFTLAIVITNVLQTVNFSSNFLLYCLVNARFRSTLKNIVHCMLCLRKKHHIRRYNRQKGMLVTSPFGVSMYRSAMIQKQTKA